MIAHLCYGYFRLGKMAEEHDTEEKILLGLILCAYDPDEMLTILKPEWSMLTGLTPQQKMDQCGLGFSLSQIFPWKHEMSIGIAHDTFCASFLIQPDLFLRLRPGYEERVKHKLTTAQIPFSVVHPGCIALQNSSKIDSLVELDKEAVVQDLNSQKISDVFKMTRPMGYGEPVRVWDCCAASGGKSLMFHDMFPVARLTVSDIRESILINLRKHFTKAGIHHYERFIADLTAPIN